MRWLFKPPTLILVSLALTLGAAVLVLAQRGSGPDAMPLEENDIEIAWLYSATSAGTWERFVTAVNTAASQLRSEYPDLVVQVDEKTFPPQTAAVPELSLKLRDGSARLIFRWYKLTSDLKTEQWVEKLVGGKRRPPLAIIGGSSSDSAIDLAYLLKQATAQKPEAAAPLLILTTATADRTQRYEIDPSASLALSPVKQEVALGESLTRIYDGRTVRFCFTNQQMANAVTRFIQRQDEIRADTDPFYVIVWEDDAYSKDLTEHFCSVLLLQSAARAAAHDWFGLAGQVLAGSTPVGLVAAASSPLHVQTAQVIEFVDYSVGGFDQPNRWEAPVVRRLIETKLKTYPHQKRPLLVLPAAAQSPARRVLRGLMRESPAEARRFVVATGDGLAFNTVYRDRNAAWPIQDLPFDLVFFCHRNPVDSQAGFRPDEQPRSENSSEGSPATGTEDLLLFVDIVKALVHTAYRDEVPPANGDDLRRRLAETTWKNNSVGFDPSGRLLFDADGNRRRGTGEHIAWLRPHIKGEQVQAEATLSVWPWTADSRQPIASLKVRYDGK